MDVSAAVHYGAGDAPRSVAMGDLDGDGTDLAVANYTSDNVCVLLGNGDGTFQAACSTARALLPIRCDWRPGGGRDEDLAVANYTSDNICILLGNGDGRFRRRCRTARVTVPLLGDRRPRRDGDEDVAVANEISDNISVLLGNVTDVPGGVQYGAGDAPGPLRLPTWRGRDEDLAVANSSDYVCVLLGTATERSRRGAV